MPRFDLDHLRARVDAGLVHARTDPLGTGLTLYDYSSKCQWDAAWDDYTLAARGLVLDGAGRVVARPFRKFFNLGEPLGQPRPGEPELIEKLDGSLVIVFHDGERWRCNTRGAWDSPQARAAADLLAPRFAAWSREPASGPDREWTLLAEYVAPDNRIVVRYAQPDCVLLGVIDRRSGEERRDWRELAAAWGLNAARSFGVAELASLDLAGGDGTREGFVAVWPCGHRVKLKFAAYLRLHKVVTGLSARAIRDSLAEGTPLDLAGMPDEFMAWYRAQHATLTAAFAARRAEVDAVWQSTRALALPDRKSHALHWRSAALPQWVMASLFRLLDGRECDDIVWRAVTPDAPFATYLRDDG